jgi:hypothetical protein
LELQKKSAEEVLYKEPTAIWRTRSENRVIRDAEDLPGWQMVYGRFSY